MAAAAASSGPVALSVATPKGMELVCKVEFRDGGARPGMGTFDVHVVDFLRGSLPTDPALHIGTLHCVDADRLDEMRKFVEYLRWGMAKTSPPKGGIVPLPTSAGGGKVILLAPASPSDSHLVVAMERSQHVPSARELGADIAKAAAKAAAEDAPSTEYSGSDAELPPHVAKQRARLFAGLPPSLMQRVVLDDVALFSVTAAPVADDMTRRLLRHLSPHATVIDGTACVGGNTLSFARSFRRVIACEIALSRARLLRANVETLGFPTLGGMCETSKDVDEVLESSASKGVVVFHGAVEDLLLGASEASLGQGLFLDPPWGGPEYKTLKSLSLFLGETPVSRLVANVARGAIKQRATGRGPLRQLQVICLKGPFNLNVQEILDEARGLLQLLEPPVMMERNRVVLLMLGIVTKRPREEDGPSEPGAKRHPLPEP
jgi:hypothetical protein